MNKAIIKKVGKILSNVVLFVFLVICIFSVFLTVLSKRDTDGAAEVFGYQMRLVTSQSMEKCEYTDVSSFKIKDIPLRSMLFIQTVPDDEGEAEEWYRELQVGDVLTFRYVYGSQVTVTHRITSITEKASGGFIIELAGDNKNDADGQLTQVIDTSERNSPNYVLGKVTLRAYWFGLLMSFLMTPVGIVFIVILPCLIIILLEVMKIAKTLSRDKREKEEEETRKKEEELEELRRKLAELEAEKNDSAGAAANSSERADSKEGRTE